MGVDFEGLRIRGSVAMVKFWEYRYVGRLNMAWDLESAKKGRNMLKNGVRISIECGFCGEWCLPQHIVERATSRFRLMLVN